MPQELEIFRAGSHTSSEGVRLTFTERDLDAIVASYDPKVHEAPCVVGHPTHDAPAVGWIHGLKRKGKSLEATVDMAASFKEQSKGFKKRSASFYMPNAPENPKPGAYYLRHVGFLGAMPPAVKGLRDASFSDDGKGLVTIEFAEGDAAEPAKDAPAKDAPADEGEAPAKFAALTPVKARGKVGTIIEARDGFFSVLFEGDTEPVRWLAEDELELSDKPASNAPTSAAAPGTASHAEPRNRTAKSRVEIELDRRAGELKAREDKLAAEERRVSRVANIAFCDGLVREGRVMPWKRETAVSFLECLADASRTVSTASFGEHEKRSFDQIFKEEFLAKLPKQVEFAELSAGDAPLNAEASPTQIAAKASAYVAEQAKAGNVVATHEAVSHVLGKR